MKIRITTILEEGTSPDSIYQSVKTDRQILASSS